MTLQEKIERYEVNDNIRSLLEQVPIALLVGIAGAGKDTIKKQLLRSDAYTDIVSHTTRPPRSNNGVPETDGVEYHFITSEEAGAMVDAHGFVEVKYVHGTIYGTSVSELEEARDAGKIAVNDLDIQGVDELKELKRDIIAIFILPPSYEVWLARLKKRYATEAEFTREWPKRRDSAIRELRHALEVPYYHFILNDDLDKAVIAAGKIAHSEDSFYRKDDEARLAARDILASIEAHLTD